MSLFVGLNLRRGTSAITGVCVARHGKRLDYSIDLELDLATPTLRLVHCLLNTMKQWT